MAVGCPISSSTKGMTDAEADRLMVVENTSALVDVNMSWNTLKLLELDGLTSPLSLTEIMSSTHEDESETHIRNTTAAYASNHDNSDTISLHTYDGDDDYNSANAACQLTGQQNWH